jgi:hypothetical protein
MAPRKPEGIVGDAAKAAAKKAAEAAKKAAVKKAAAEAKAKAAKKVVAKTTKSAASRANPRNSYALGKTVVHGSPVTGLKEIVPKTGSATRPTENVNFGWSPSSKFFGTLTTNSRNYARGGSVYIGKVPRSSVVKTNNNKIIISTAPIKVKKEISAKKPNLKSAIENAVPGSRFRDVKKSIKPKKKKK